MGSKTFLVNLLAFFACATTVTPMPENIDARLRANVLAYLGGLTANLREYVETDRDRMLFEELCTLLADQKLSAAGSLLQHLYVRFGLGILR